MASLARNPVVAGALSLIGLSVTSVLGYLLATLAPFRPWHMSLSAPAASRVVTSRRLDRPTVNDELGRMTAAERMLERLHGSAEANRRFAADASHELRSPLSPRCLVKSTSR